LIEPAKITNSTPLLGLVNYIIEPMISKPTNV